MPLTVPFDRGLALNTQKAFGRLRGLLRQQPIPIADAVDQARACGRVAYAADMRLDIMVGLLTSMPVPDAMRARSLPESLVHAAVEGYLLAAERAPASDAVGV